MPIFFSMFKTLEGKTVLLELKNSLQLKGKLVSVDQYLNLKLDEVEVVDRENYPQLVRLLLRVYPIATNNLARDAGGMGGCYQSWFFLSNLDHSQPHPEALLIHHHLPPTPHTPFLFPPSLFSPSYFPPTPPL